MNSDTLDIAGLARYLSRDAREVEKLASQGRLPGRRVAGDWRFSRDEVDRWLEEQLSELSDIQLDHVERGACGYVSSRELDLVLAPLLGKERMEIPLQARTAAGVIERLVQVANSGWQVFDPQRVVSAVRVREEQASTAMPGGVAIPHPRRTTPEMVGESLIAFGRTTTGIPFGGSHGALTDLFFLILCPDDRQHLQALARLARIFNRPEFLIELRAAATPDDCVRLIGQAEESLLSSL